MLKEKVIATIPAVAALACEPIMNRAYKGGQTMKLCIQRGDPLIVWSHNAHMLLEIECARGQVDCNKKEWKHFTVEIEAEAVRMIRDASKSPLAMLRVLSVVNDDGQHFDLASDTARQRVRVGERAPDKDKVIRNAQKGRGRAQMAAYNVELLSSIAKSALTMGATKPKYHDPIGLCVEMPRDSERGAVWRLAAGSVGMREELISARWCIMPSKMLPTPTAAERAKQAEAEDHHAGGEAEVEKAS